MIEINDNTVAVESEAELRTYVGNNTINYIYLANNITMTSGITIYAGKTSLVIDGEYPIGSGVRNEFTDMNSSSYYDTIGIDSTSSITLTFRNMIIHGRNYYGVPYIGESIALIRNTDNVSVIYENMEYTGPQITYNRNGRTRYTDCNITIQQGGNTPGEEVGEVNRVEIGGTTTIVHTSLSNNDDYAIFWFTGNTSTMSFTILEGADVHITSRNCYFMYNMEPIWGTAYPLPYVVQTGARLRIDVNRGFSYDSRNQVSLLTVDENASFSYVQTANNGTAASMYINGALTVRQGASFYMQASNSTQPLINFTNGTGRSLNVSNPLSFVLYCANNPALVSSGTTQVSLTGGQVNTWTVPGNGSFEDRPEYKWFKVNYANPVVFTGSFTSASTSVTGNLTDEDNPHPSDSDMHLNTARVISIGDWGIMTNPVEDDGRPVTGWTEPYANMRIIYELNGEMHTINGAAGEDGRFSIETSGETPPNVPEGTVVEVWSNIPYLIKNTRTTSIAAGSLMITRCPDVIVFKIPPISTDPILLPRTVTDATVAVYDNRADLTQWELMASVTEPLHTDSGDSIPDAVVFVETSGGTPVALSSTPTVVRTVSSPVLGETEIFWPEDQGILIHVTEPLRIGVRYYTRLNWELHAGSNL